MLFNLRNFLPNYYNFLLKLLIYACGFKATVCSALWPFVSWRSVEPAALVLRVEELGRFWHWSFYGVAEWHRGCCKVIFVISHASYAFFFPYLEALFPAVLYFICTVPRVLYQAPLQLRIWLVTFFPTNPQDIDEFTNWSLRQTSVPEDGSNMFLRNIFFHLPYYIISKARILHPKVIFILRITY
jgi:hypothetical protein